MHGFMRALLKALRLVKQNRQITMGALMKFSALHRELAARSSAIFAGTSASVMTPFSMRSFNLPEHRLEPSSQSTAIPSWGEGQMR